MQKKLYGEEIIASYQKLVKKPNEKNYKKLLNFVCNTNLNNKKIIEKINIGEAKMVNPAGEALKNTRESNEQLTENNNSKDKKI